MSTATAGTELMAGQELRVPGLVVRKAGSAARIEEVRLPRPGPDDVIVDIAAAGLCHSDISLASGDLRQPMPALLGHEAAGTVSWCGENVTGVSVGATVVLDWAPACGSCQQCVKGRPFLCIHGGDRAKRPYGKTRDGEDLFAALGTGSFARRVVRPADAVHSVPADVPPDVAAIMGCAVLTGAGAVFNAADVRPGESVAVVGLGGVGLSAVQAARIAGASPLLAADTNPEKKWIAERLGADEFIQVDAASLVPAVRKLTDGWGADHVIDCVGRGTTTRDSWSACKRGGTVTVVGIGTVDDVVEFNTLELFHYARRLQGCVYGSSHVARDLQRLFQLYRAGLLPVERMITSKIPFENLETDLRELIASSHGRTVVHFDEY